MNIFRLIAMAILFIVVYLLWAVGRWLVLPYPLLEVFPHIPPLPLWEALYSIFTGAMTAIFWMIFWVLVVLYLVYCAIRKYAPDIFGIKSTLLGMTPFGELNASGVFPLFDDIVRIVFSVMPFGDRILGSFQSVGRFMTKGSVWAYYEVRGEPPPFWVLAALNRDTAYFDRATDNLIAGAKNDLTSSASNVVSWERPVAPPASSSNLTPEEAEYINEKYRQCLEESTEPVDPDLSGLEKAKIISRNTNANIKCSMGRVQTQANILNWKLQ